MTTHHVTTDQQHLHMQVHVNDDGIVVAVGSPERPCFRSNFLGQPWEKVREMFLSRGWEVK